MAPIPFVLSKKWAVIENVYVHVNIYWTITIRVRNASKRFSENNSRPRDLGITVPKWPKMTENGPSNRVIPILLETGMRNVQFLT